MLRVEVAALWQLVPRLDRVARWYQKQGAKLEVRLKFPGHVHASTLSGFGFLIDRGLGYFRQGLVGCFFLI